MGCTFKLLYTLINRLYPSEIYVFLLYIKIVGFSFNNVLGEGLKNTTFYSE